MSRYYEVEEERIKNQIEQLLQVGEPTENLDRILSVGQIYKDHGLTPIYVFDDYRDGFMIKIAETMDKSKLH